MATHKEDGFDIVSDPPTAAAAHDSDAQRFLHHLGPTLRYRVPWARVVRGTSLTADETLALAGLPGTVQVHAAQKPASAAAATASRVLDMGSFPKSPAMPPVVVPMSPAGPAALGLGRRIPIIPKPSPAQSPKRQRGSRGRGGGGKGRVAPGDSVSPVLPPSQPQPAAVIATSAASRKSTGPPAPALVPALVPSSKPASLGVGAKVVVHRDKPAAAAAAAAAAAPAVNPPAHVNPFAAHFVGIPDPKARPRKAFDLSAMPADPTITAPSADTAEKELYVPPKVPKSSIELPEYLKT